MKKYLIIAGVALVAIAAANRIPTARKMLNG